MEQAAAELLKLNDYLVCLHNVSPASPHSSWYCGTPPCSHHGLVPRLLQLDLPAQPATATGRHLVRVSRKHPVVLSSGSNLQISGEGCILHDKSALLSLQDFSPPLLSMKRNFVPCYSPVSSLGCTVVLVKNQDWARVVHSFPALLLML